MIEIVLRVERFIRKNFWFLYLNFILIELWVKLGFGLVSICFFCNSELRSVDLLILGCLVMVNCIGIFFNLVLFNKVLFFFFFVFKFNFVLKLIILLSGSVVLFELVFFFG